MKENARRAHQEDSTLEQGCPTQPLACRVRGGVIKAIIDPVFACRATLANSIWKRASPFVISAPSGSTPIHYRLASHAKTVKRVAQQYKTAVLCAADASRESLWTKVQTLAKLAQRGHTVTPSRRVNASRAKLVCSSQLEKFWSSAWHAPLENMEMFQGLTSTKVFRSVLVAKQACIKTAKGKRPAASVPETPATMKSIRILSARRADFLKPSRESRSVRVNLVQTQTRSSWILDQGQASSRFQKTDHARHARREPYVPAGEVNKTLKKGKWER